MSSINQFQQKQHSFNIEPNGYQVGGFLSVQTPDSAQGHPPYTNRGGIELSPLYSTPLPLPPPTPKPSAIIDYLSITFQLSGVQVWRKVKPGDFPDLYLNNDDEVQGFLIHLSGLVSELNYFSSDKGMFGYRKSGRLFRDDQPAGIYAYDGNSNTCLVSFSGVGCSGVDMLKMRQLLEVLPGCKITRVDCAHDDLDGAISLDKWEKYYWLGMFHIHGAMPALRSIINSNSSKGNTLYIGNKANGKEACIYEKGKQLGDGGSSHVRVEGRLTAVDRVIPFEVLTSPAVFLAAMYPAFGYLCAFHERVDVIKKQAKISLELSVSYAKNNCGKLVNVLKGLGHSSDEIVSALLRPGMPKRLQLPFAPCPF